MVFTGDLKQLGKVNFYRVLFFTYFNFIEPVKDAFIFKPSSIHGRLRAAVNIWNLFQNFHLTEKVRSAGGSIFRNSVI